MAKYIPSQEKLEEEVRKRLVGYESNRFLIRIDDEFRYNGSRTTCVYVHIRDDSRFFDLGSFILDKEEDGIRSGLLYKMLVDNVKKYLNNSNGNRP